MTNDNTEDQVTAQATEEIERRGAEQFTIELDLKRLLAIVSMVQIGLRYPNMQGHPRAAAASEWTRESIEKIDPAHGPIWELLNRGF